MPLLLRRGAGVAVAPGHVANTHPAHGERATRAALSPRTMAAVEFARSQSRSGPGASRLARDALARAGYRAEEMREIAYVAAATDFSNRAHTIPAIPARSLEKMPQQWIARLLRPLLGRVIRKHRYRGQAGGVRPGTFAPVRRSGAHLRRLSDRADARKDDERDVGVPSSDATLQAIDVCSRSPRTRVRGVCGRRWQVAPRGRHRRRDALLKS